MFEQKKRAGVSDKTPTRICLIAYLFKFPHLQSFCTCVQWSIR
jgi:hypothetical protein